jgi:ribonuclease BN (tRNA processing enzyme)
VLSSRLAAIGASWESVHAVILTHTHGDHWRDATLAHLASRRVPIHGHSAHFDQLSIAGPSFAAIALSLKRAYEENQPFELAPGLTCRPVAVSHDADPTFAFRFDKVEGTDAGLAWSVGHASDLGCGSEELVEAFAGVDVLAVEYNHDERMERSSRRPAFLVNRVLGDSGHLSNRQAAALTRAVAARSGVGFPRHLVQLHLSRDCNHPSLAEAAGRRALSDLSPAASVVTARADVPSRSVLLSRHPLSDRRREPRPQKPAKAAYTLPITMRAQPSLPGFEVA